MDTPEGGSGSNRKPQIDVIKQLRAQYGSPSKIPEEALDAAGYVRRVMDGGLVRLMPRDHLDKLAQKNPDWNKPLKEQEQPFERIQVELPTTTENFRFIPISQLRLLSKKLEEVEYAFFPNWFDGTSILSHPDEDLIDVRVQNLSIFSEDLMRFMVEEKLLHDNFYKTMFFEPLPMRIPRYREDKTVEDPNDFGHYDFVAKFRSPNGSITSDNVGEMYNELSRLEGYYGDVGELREMFAINLAEPLAPSDELEERPQLKKLKEMGIVTYADFIRYVFPKYLEHVGLPEMAAVVKTTQSYAAMGETLQYLDASDTFREEEKELKKSIRNASPEERVGLNSKLKSIEAAKRRKKQIRLGVIDYFSAPEVYVDIVKRKIKEAQSFLRGGSDKRDYKASFVLDARPNEELDRDPGQVSGDCTAGRPLPFDSGSIPLYNVKVFDEGKHMGNIYLLVTTLMQGEDQKKAWHLDAIQIPRPNVNWEEGIGVIMKVLSESAKSKGIDAITTNSALHEISNYDYIARAVEKHWENGGRQIVNVKMPDEQLSDSQSMLQGKGDDIVLWSTEELSKPRLQSLEVNEDMFNLQNGLVE